MIRIHIDRDQGRIAGFRIKNHGPDIICAAVSVLAQNTINAMEQFTDAGFQCELEPSGGYLAVAIDKKDRQDEKSQLLLDTMVLGFQGIKAEYGEHIEISLEEVQGC